MIKNPPRLKGEGDIRYLSRVFAQFEMPRGYDVKAFQSYAGRTCGCCAIATVTGWHPDRFTRRFLRPTQDDFPVATMRRALDWAGWDSVEFGAEELVNLGKGGFWASDVASDSEHLFMVVAHTTKEEASWFVFWNRKVYHNAREMPNSALFCLTNPMIKCLLVKPRKKTK